MGGRTFAEYEASRTGAKELTKEEREYRKQKENQYIRLTWQLLRRANKNATEASRVWTVKDAELKQWFVNNNISDELQQFKIKKENLGLNDAFDTWSFWEREAKRLAAAIEAELSVRKLLELL